MPDGIGTTFDPEVAKAALAGLQAKPKTLPSKLFYDARGCTLFDQIKQLPEYYLTRTELSLLRQVAPEIARHAEPESAVIEYGAGTEEKAAILLDAMDRPSAYVPIDVAGDSIHEAAGRLRALFPTLPVLPIVADFLAPLLLPAAIGMAPRVGFFPGSTIGNLEPAVAVQFLAQVKQTLGRNALFIVGADLHKSPDIVIPAYDDAAGVTAAFNLNILTHLNREAGATFDLGQFAHQAIWNPRESRIEMHLRSLCEQTVTVAGLPIAFEEGETIHTENSYKHTQERLRSIAKDAGWTREAVWTDPRNFISLNLFRAGGF